MSKLFSKAKLLFESAEYHYRHIADDDCHLDLCCYDLQQSIEFALKGIVELNGLDYAENHEIRSNLNILNRNQIEIPYEKELRLLANTLYQWETDSRYKDSFIAAIGDVDEAFIYAKALLDYINERITPVDIEEKNFPDNKLE